MPIHLVTAFERTDMLLSICLPNISKLNLEYLHIDIKCVTYFELYIKVFIRTIYISKYLLNLLN